MEADTQEVAVILSNRLSIEDETIVISDSEPAALEKDFFNRDIANPRQPPQALRSNDVVEEEMSSGQSYPPKTTSIHALSPSMDNPLDPKQFHPDHTVFFKPPPRTISQLPLGSRMFVGNISSDRTSQPEIAAVFAKYGNIYEIILRGTYGFVQFDSIEACNNAIAGESGNMFAGLRFVSKDRNSELKNAQNARNDAKNGPVHTGRGNSYKPGSRGNNESRENRTRDRSRSRNRSPDARKRRDRSRSRSPRARRNSDANPLPTRHGADVPEAQILVLDVVQRSYISKIENALKSAGFKTDNIFLSAKLSLKVIIKQLISEGVKTIVLLERFYEKSNKLCMQVILSNGTIQEYENVTIDQALTVMIKEKMERHNSHMQHQPLTIPAMQPLQAQQSINPLQAVLSQLIASNADPKTLMLVANAIQLQQGQQAQPMAYQAPAIQNQNPFYANPASQQSLGLNYGLPQNLAANQYVMQGMMQSEPQRSNQQIDVSDLLSKLKGITQQGFMGQQQMQQPQLHQNFPQLVQSDPRSQQYNPGPTQQTHQRDNGYAPASNHGYQPPTQPSASNTQDLLSMLQSLKR